MMPKQMMPKLSPTQGTRSSRRVRRAVVAIVAIAAGAALAVGVAVTIQDGWRDAGQSAPAARDVAPPVTPVAQALEPIPEPPPAPVARPAPPAVPQEKLVPAPKPKRVASTSPGPAPTPRNVLFAPRSDALLDAGPVDRQCVPRALRARRDPSARLPAEIAVRFPVAASGAVGRIEVLGDVADGDLAKAIADAVRSCQFHAGTDDDGRPVAQSLIMRFKFPGGVGAPSR